MASAVEVVDLLSDDDDEVVAVSSYHARGAVARRRGNPMSPKASLSLRKRGLKSPNKVSAVVKRCKTPDDDVVEVFGRSPEAKYKKTNASLLEILQVFPDIDTNHATALLTKNSNHAPTVLQMIVESGLYPKQEHSQVKITQSVQPLILHRNELEKSYKYDYTSELSFEPSSVYQREAKALLAQNFRFFSQKAVDGAMATSKHHYAIAYNKLRKAIMQQDAPPKDEEQEYTQFLMMENYERGFKLARKQLKSLQAVTEIKDKCRIVISKKREACKVLVSDPILKDEMDYVMSRQRDLTRRMHAYRERKEARRKAKANDATIECNCCFTDVSLDEMVQCKDGHLFCFDCLKRHANSRIFDQGNFGTHPITKEPATELLCMTDCGEGFLPECLQKILPPKVMSKYHEMLFQMALSNAHVDDLW
jgi:TRIAD3 protein (E3 ubiquitin-protein ligase RNF216)